MQAALVHGAEQADGLQGHGFAAGIRAGDDEGVKLLPETQIDGYGLCLIQERMARLSQRQAPDGCLGGRCFHFVRELRLGEDQIKPYQQQAVFGKIVRMFRAGRRQFTQDFLNLQLFFRGQLAQLVVCLDCRHGLNEKRHPRGGYIMHKPRHRVLVFYPHRQDIAVGAHGDNGLLQSLRIGRGRENFVQRVPRPGGSGTHLPADIGQIRRRAVGNLILAGDGRVDSLFQILVCPQGMKQRIDAGFFLPVICDIGLAQSCAAGKPCDVQELSCVQDTAEACPFQRRTDVSRAAEGGAAQQGHQPRGIGGFLQSSADLFRMRGRQKSSRSFLPQL